jgi:hypothetical protein
MKKIYLVILLIVNVIIMFSCNTNNDARPYSFYYLPYENSEIEFEEPKTLITYEDYQDFKDVYSSSLKQVYYPGDFFNSYSLFVFSIEDKVTSPYLHLEVEKFLRTDSHYYVNLNEYQFIETSEKTNYLVFFEIKKLDKSIEDKIKDSLLDKEEITYSLEYDITKKEFGENPYFIFYLKPDSVEYKDKSVFSTYSEMTNSTLLSQDVKNLLPFDPDFFDTNGFVIIKLTFTSSSIGYHMHEYKLVENVKTDTSLRVKFNKSASIVNRGLESYDTYLVLVFKRGLTNLDYDIIDV